MIEDHDVVHCAVKERLDSPAAGPGYREHLTATGIESILASITGVNWDKYEEEVSADPPPETIKPNL